MNINQLVRLTLCSTLMVAPLQAQTEVCASYFDIAFDTIIKDKTEVGAKCESLSRLEDYYAPPLTVCMKPGCVEAIKKAYNYVPSCIHSMTKLNAKTVVLAVAKMCENEAKGGNLPAAGDDSVDDVAGSLDSIDSGSDGISIRACTIDEIEEVNKLQESKERQKVCGKWGANYDDVRESALCSRPECMAYYKDTLLKKVPDCQYKTSLKFSIALCDAAPETLPSQSVTTVPCMALMVIVAVVALMMA